MTKSQKIAPIQQQEMNLATKEDIARFKTLFYVLNGKPDTQIKLLTEKKKITTSDIHDLNAKVIEKLNNHKVPVSITEVSVNLTDKRKLDFGTWAEFKQQKWDTAAGVTQISMKWDFCLEIPGYKVPQRHTLRVRMGAQVKPKELFQIIMGDEVGNLEIDEATANVVCKVDFINVVISHELINLVTEWHKSLSPISKENNIERFFNRHDDFLAEGVALLFPLSIIMGFYALIKFTLVGENQVTLPLIENLIFVIFIFIGMLFISVFIGQRFRIRVLHGIQRFHSSPIFDVTKGDRNRSADVKNKNNSVFRDLAINLLVGLLVNIISFIINILQILKTK